MSVRRVFQPARLLWLAPALLGLLASPGAARGACGDQAHPATTGLDADLASLARLDRTALGSGGLPSPTAPPLPCTGPSCSPPRHAAPIVPPPAPRTSPECSLVATRTE